MPNLRIESGESDDKCERCNKASDEVVAISVNDGDNIFMVCQSCITDAVTSAVDDGDVTVLSE